VALLLALLDLGPAHEVLARCYSRRAGGRPPKDPVAMLRCFVLMGALGEAAVNAWVDRLSKEPILAILSGFEPRARPGVGTFYDFANRILDGEHARRCEHRRRKSDALRGSRGRFRRNLKAEKAETKARTQAELARNQETPVANA
ncbi:MAG: hypothetical protein AAB284_06785, partial [Chloroflexota bacterium]